jgi:hypothetical protein
MISYFDVFTSFLVSNTDAVLFSIKLGAFEFMFFMFS